MPIYGNYSIVGLYVCRNLPQVGVGQRQHSDERLDSGHSVVCYYVDIHAAKAWVKRRQIYTG